MFSNSRVIIKYKLYLFADLAYIFLFCITKLCLLCKQHKFLKLFFLERLRLKLFCFIVLQMIALMQHY